MVYLPAVQTMLLITSNIRNRQSGKIILEDICTGVIRITLASNAGISRTKVTTRVEFRQPINWPGLDLPQPGSLRPLGRN
jgi:hypothetical protein